MILDIIIILFVLLLAFIGLKRGIAKTIYGLLCLALAGFLAYLCGKLLAEFVYNNYILSSITESVKSSFAVSSVNSGKVSENVFSAIPGVFTAVLAGVGVTQNGFATSIDSASDFSQAATMTVVDKVISPVIISFLTVGFIIILFLIFIILLKLVIGRWLLKIFNLPVIKWVNSLLGFVLGLCEGIIIVIIVISILRMVSFFSGNHAVSEELMDSSIVFSSIYNWNFTEVLSDIKFIK